MQKCYVAKSENSFLQKKTRAIFFPLKKLIKAFSHQSEIVEQISAVHLQMVVIKKGLEKKKKKKEERERRDSWGSTSFARKSNGR